MKVNSRLLGSTRSGGPRWRTDSMVVSGGSVSSTVQLYSAGVGSTTGVTSRYLKRFIASTPSVCSVSAVSGPATNGEVHGTNAEPSTEQRKVASGWSDVKV